MLPKIKTLGLPNESTQGWVYYYYHSKDMEFRIIHSMSGTDYIVTCMLHHRLAAHVRADDQLSVLAFIHHFISTHGTTGGNHDDKQAT